MRVVVADPHQHDRQVARDAVAPQPRLPAPVADQDAGLRPAQRRGVDDRAGQSAVDLGIGLGGVELLQQDLAVRPGQLEDAVRQAGIVSTSRSAPSTASRDSATPVTRSIRTVSFGCKQDELADADDRIEHRTLRCSTAAPCRPWPLGSASVRPRPMNCIRSVSNDASPIGRALDRHQVHHPRRPLLGRARPARAQIACRSRTSSVCTNRLLNAGCDRSWAWAGQHHLGIAGHLDGARRLRSGS